LEEATVMAGLASTSGDLEYFGESEPFVND
jgi:hypothetical protein